MVAFGSQVMLRGPNQAGGKSTALAMLMAYHLSGLYPDEWTGPRFDHPISAALGGVSAKNVRDLLTDRMLGTHGERGTGYIPASCVDEDKILYSGGQVRYLIDHFKVKHHTNGKFDGWSRCQTFSYKQGFELVMGFSFHLIGCDEEPLNFEFYDELVARTNVTGGIVRIAETPMQGESEFYLYFEENQSGECTIIPYTIDDCDHLPKETIEKLYRRYPPGHPLREARLFGRPVRGEGLALPTNMEKVLIEPFSLSSAWRWIIGLDFPHTTGYFAAAKLCYDLQNDIVYLVECYKDRAQNSAIYVDRLKGMGGHTIPCAWPHDAARGMTDGVTVAERYRNMGAAMRPEYAHRVTWDGKKSNALMDILEELIDRMETGRFRVFDGPCRDFEQEKRKYRLDNGLVKRGQDDHTIDAVVKGLMDLRHARAIYDRHGRHRDRPKLRQTAVDFFRS